MRYYQYLSTCFILILSGCATRPIQHADTSPAASNRPVFVVSGAIAAKNRHQGWTATFYWTQQAPQNYQILIYGPLGSDAMEITQQQNNVIYREGGKIIRAHHAEDLLAKETGIRLPVNHLYHWIKGTPAPGPITSITRSAEHDILTLQQAGYTLEYSDYRAHYPYKIRLTGHHLMVKIVIKQWS